MIRREDAQFEFGTGRGRWPGRWPVIPSRRLSDNGSFEFSWQLEMSIDFGTVLDTVNADNLFCGINPIEDAVITHAELAESGQIHRHSNEPAMHHASGIVREPLNFALHARADSGVQPGELSVGLAAYFDLVGHGWWRGFQGLNLPATSSRRAARNSAMMSGFCAVSQS